MAVQRDTGHRGRNSPPTAPCRTLSPWIHLHPPRASQQGIQLPKFSSGGMGRAMCPSDRPSSAPFPVLTRPCFPGCVALTLWKVRTSHVRLTCFLFCLNKPVISKVSSGGGPAATAHGPSIGQQRTFRFWVSLGSKEPCLGHSGAAQGHLSVSSLDGPSSSPSLLRWPGKAQGRSQGIQGSSPLHLPLLPPPPPMSQEQGFWVPRKVHQPHRWPEAVRKAGKWTSQDLSVSSAFYFTD